LRLRPAILPNSSGASPGSTGGLFGDSRESPGGLSGIYRGSTRDSPGLNPTIARDGPFSGFSRDVPGVHPGCIRGSPGFYPDLPGCPRIHPGDCRDTLVDLQMAYRLDLE
jgi:hypothetical protein